MARKDIKGRSKGSGPFVQLHHWLMDSAAWQALSPADKAVYVALRRTYDGTNNGRIGMGVRSAARLAGVCKNTAAKSLARLTDLGFIECARPATFRTNSCLQAEWRLTDQRCDKTGALPTKAFMKWKPDPETAKAKRKPPSKSKSEKADSPGLIVGQSSADRPATVLSKGHKDARRAA